MRPTLSTPGPYLEITIVDGDLTIEGKQFAGEGCAKLAALFEGLGNVTDTWYKPEFHQAIESESVLLRQR